MARNEEKANSMLNRWRLVRLIQDGVIKPKKIVTPAQCTSIRTCEFQRRKLIKSISDKVSQIQNQNLGEYRIRDLNDEINNLIKEKHTWEQRIVELNGPNYLAQKALYEEEGQGATLAGNPDYVYFGAAKSLAGIKELFDSQQKQEEHQAKKAELYKGVDATYFGFKDDDDGALAQVEQETEQRIMQEQAQHSKASTNSHAVLLQQAYIHVPSNEQVQNYLLEKRKREMLKNLTKYVQIQV